MEITILLVGICCWLGSTMAQQNPCATVNQGIVTPKINLPALPTKAFKAVVRAEIINKNFTVEATEYVDEDANAAALVINQYGQKSIVLMSYNTDEVFFMGPNPNSLIQTAGPFFCEAVNLTTNDDTQLFGMNVDTSSGKPHLYSTTKILNFMNGTEVYKGRFTVSGIPANKWSSCVYWSQLNANFTLDYYFTVPGWKTPSGFDQVPLRADVYGSRDYKNGTITTFHHIYQYTNFQAYVNDPETIFSTPPGVFCLKRKKTRTLPALNNHFYFREEVSNPGLDTGGLSILSENDIWYNFDLKLLRYDQRIAPDGVSRDFVGTTGPYSIIHDYGLGVQYTIARDISECSVDPIPLSAKDFDGIYNTTSKTMTMRNPLQFFNLDTSNYLYVGKRVARSQQCDVFQTVLTNLPNHGIVIFEVYFFAGKITAQYEIHDFDQDSLISQNFDVTPCFTGTASKDFELFIRAPDTSLMPQFAPYVQDLLAMELTINVGISPTRLQRTRLHWDRQNIYYEGTLLDRTPSIAKYSVTKNSVMVNGAGKALSNIPTTASCASNCDNQQEWNCVQFDYCDSTMVCTLGRFTNTSILQNSSQCYHYRRVLGGGFDSQVSLSTMWQKLKNLVYGKQLTLTLPLPDSRGMVDMTADTTQLDDSQKIVFRAVSLTDQVINNANRNPGSSQSMSQFKSMANKEGKGYDTLLRGKSVDDCASSCVDEQTYNCQSFAYCWTSGACFMSRQHPEERPDLLKNNPSCDLYYRDYTSNFQQYPGMSVLSASNAVYQNVLTASQCAKLCTYYNSFHCESFDFCTDINTCVLGKTHYFDVPKANIQQKPSCAHFSRAYIQDFVPKSHSRIRLTNNRIIQGVSPQQCAQLCVKETTFTCNSFDYCGNYSECRITDTVASKVGQVTLETSAYCDVYLRQYSNVSPTKGPTNAPTHTIKPTSTGNHAKPTTSSSGVPQQQRQTGGNNNNYSGGAMGGLAIAMIVLGLILGVVGIFLYDRYFRRRGPDDGMTVAFSKASDSVS